MYSIRALKITPMPGCLSTKNTDFSEATWQGEDSKYRCMEHIAKAPVEIHIRTLKYRSFYAHSMHKKAEHTIIQNEKKLQMRKRKKQKCC